MEAAQGAAVADADHGEPPWSSAQQTVQLDFGILVQSRGRFVQE
jgi:hypothetical protein